jgi:rod shape-determining protein MreD
MARRMRIEVKVGYVLLALFALIGLQMKLLPHFALGGIKPDLFLFAVCYLSLRGGETRGAIIGFALGLLEDSLSLSPLGMKALSFALVGFLLGVARRDLFLDSVLAQILLLFLAGVVSGLTTLISLNFFLIPRPMGTTFFRLILPESFFTALCGLLLIFVFHRLRPLKAT